LFTLKIKGRSSVVPTKLAFAVPAFPVKDQDCEKVFTEKSKPIASVNEHLMAKIFKLKNLISYLIISFNLLNKEYKEIAFKWNKLYKSVSHFA
jgi:hypothetical protein